MLKRKLYNSLLEWKEKSQGKSALLIDGARRIGKSYLCEEFGKNEYKSYLIIDFGNISREIVDLLKMKVVIRSIFYKIVQLFMEYNF